MSSWGSKALFVLIAATLFTCPASGSYQQPGLCASEEQDSASFFQKMLVVNQRSATAMKPTLSPLGPHHFPSSTITSQRAEQPRRPRSTSFGGETRNQNSASKITHTLPMGKTDCPQTPKVVSLSAGAKLYHGTPTGFSGAVRGPGWFASSLPPFNDLAFHVPMVWMCGGHKGRYDVPGQYYLKEFALRAPSTFPRKKLASDFYDDDDEQPEEAEDFCDRCVEGDEIGFLIDQDVVKEQQEFIVCDPGSSLRHVADHAGTTSWVTPPTNDVPAARGYADGVLELDVGTYGKYRLDCYDMYESDSFTVVTQPAIGVRIGSHAGEKPRRSSFGF